MNRARHCPKRWQDKSPRKGSVCAGDEDEDYNAPRFSASAASPCIVFEGSLSPRCLCKPSESGMVVRFKA